MTKIYIIRHGEAAAGWDKDLDPPLSERGKQQALEASSQLQEMLAGQGKVICYSSPIRRARETAEAFANATGLDINIRNEVAEIPSPGLGLKERMPWLMSVMRDNWGNLDTGLRQWRNDCLEFIANLEQDSVIFSHYIAINVLIGSCQNKDEVICYHPDNCSIHQFQLNPELQIIELGKQADTRIN